jgi:hypothetical protein
MLRVAVTFPLDSPPRQKVPMKNKKPTWTVNGRRFRSEATAREYARILGIAWKPGDQAMEAPWSASKS